MKRFAYMITISLMTGLLMGCSKSDRTIAGTALGAGVGAAAGSALGGTGGAIIGGAAGAVAGGAIGRSTY